MKRATHWVTCNETSPAYGVGYEVLAVLDKDSRWRCAEKRITGAPYASVLTGVTVISALKPKAKR